VLDRFAWLVEGMTVHPERMLRNLESSHGLVYSGRALLALVEAGLERERAYDMVQRNALTAWEEEVPFRALLEADPQVSGHLGEAELDRIFDLQDVLRHVDEVFDRTIERLGGARV
jgi:adenylosuccinate lyase